MEDYSSGVALRKDNTWYIGWSVCLSLYSYSGLRHSDLFRMILFAFLNILCRCFHILGSRKILCNVWHHQFSSPSQYRTFQVHPTHFINGSQVIFFATAIVTNFLRARVDLAGGFEVGSSTRWAARDFIFPILVLRYKNFKCFNFIQNSCFGTRISFNASSCISQRNVLAMPRFVH